MEKTLDDISRPAPVPAPVRLSDVARAELTAKAHKAYSPVDNVCVALEPLGSDHIRNMRKRTGLSQAEFATKYGFNLSTLKKWEQGQSLPTGGAQALLRECAGEPQMEVA